MDAIIVSQLDEELERRLRQRAAYHGRTIEAEVQEILRRELSEPGLFEPVVLGNLGDAIRAIVDPAGGIDIELPSRTAGRELPRFD